MRWRGGASLLCVMLVAFCGLVPSTARAGTIDTTELERAWPRQYVHSYEIGRHEVVWRQHLSRREGILAGVSFLAPSDPQRTWKLVTDYSDLGRASRDVKSLTMLEDTDTRKVIRVTVKVLWKTLTFTFVVEQEPPETIRFALVEQNLMIYRGVCRLRPDGEGTRLEVATLVKPAVRVPFGLLVLAERVVILQGVRDFLKLCEAAPGRD